MAEPLRRRPLLVLSLAVACVIWAVFAVGRPLPPRTIVMTTGPEGGAYQELGETYRGALARNSVDLKVVTSLGDVENLNRLRDPNSGVSAGFVSGGLTSAKESPGVVTLGTISHDPIWIFCRGLPHPAQPQDLKGKRISIGPEGGGTRVTMLEFLRANDLEKEVTALPLTPGAGGEALLRGEIDCACMLTASDAPIVKKLLAEEGVNLLSFPRADAYLALHPHFRKLTVPRGVGSLAKNLPPEDVTLLASTASLLVREDLHPAIQFLLLEAAHEIHSGPGIFRKPGQFPAAEPVDVPLSKEARTYYKSGGTFLQRHLPFWLGALATRLLFILVPLAAVVYPLARLIPAVIRFAVEERLTKLYTELRHVETRVRAGGPEALAAEKDLRRLEEKVAATKVPARSARALYTLKQHVALVRERLAEARQTS